MNQAATSEPKAGKPATTEYGEIIVERGQFIQMQGANWFRCTDVNQALSRELSAIAVALEPFSYDPEVGALNKVVKNFTLRQFYADPERQQKCYSEMWLARWFEDLSKRGQDETVKKIEPVIRAGIAEFERQYRPTQREQSKRPFAA